MQIIETKSYDEEYMIVPYPKVLDYCDKQFIRMNFVSPTYKSYKFLKEVKITHRM